SKGRLNINGKAMRERFQRHMKAFTESKRKAESTGFGVTEDDTKKTLYTVAHKPERWTRSSGDDQTSLRYTSSLVLLYHLKNKVDARSLAQHLD
ncbi:hypothetical protein BG015_006696, partial [Linnemannia schmuckeri]